MRIEPTPVAAEEELGGGWVLLRPFAVPDRWRARAIECALIRVAPGEITGEASSLGPLGELPAQDVDLLKMTARGLTTAAIGRRLGVTARTVQRRLARVRERLRARSNAEVIVLAVREGLLTQNDTHPGRGEVPDRRKQ